MVPERLLAWAVGGGHSCARPGQTESRSKALQKAEPGSPKYRAKISAQLRCRLPR